MTTLGNPEILKLEKVAFLSSRKVPPAAVMKCYDWATEMRDKGVCVMGGFQSPLERDVLMFLLQGKQPVVWVLAHKLWTERSIPKPYRELIAAGRLLVVSPVAQTACGLGREHDFGTFNWQTRDRSKWCVVSAYR